MRLLDWIIPARACQWPTLAPPPRPTCQEVAARLRWWAAIADDELAAPGMAGDMRRLADKLDQR